MTSRKGQSSLEQLMVTGLGLLFISLIFYVAMNFANDSIRSAQGKETVDKLAYASEYVSSLGPGAKETVRISVPEGLEAFEVSGNRVYLRASLSSGPSDFFATTKATLVGSVPTNPGVQDIVLTVMPNGAVRMGNDQLTCSPTSISKTIVQGGSDSASINITDVTDVTITGISATLSGNIGDMVSLSQPASSLAPGASNPAGLTFSVPGSKSSGSYTGTVTVNGSNSSQCYSTVSIYVTRLGGPDNAGPIITLLSASPVAPTPSTPITIYATGSDATTGNSGIISCQSELDASGIWNDMAAVGIYGQVTQGVSYALGTLGAGNHSVAVRCIDSAYNLGASSSLAFTVAYAVVDTTGPLVTALSVTPSSPTTIDSIVINATGSDLTTGGSNISMCQLSLDGSPTWNNMAAIGGAYGTQVTQAVSYPLGNLSAGSHSLSVRCNDSAGNLGSATSLAFNVTPADTTGPIVFSIIHTPVPAYTNSSILITTVASDNQTGSHNISMCQLRLDANLTWYNMTPVGGSYNAVTINATYNLSSQSAGNHTVFVQCTDSLGNAGNVSNYTFLVSLVPDLSGPTVFSILHTPSPTYNTSSITINATASDNQTGNSNLSICQISLDASPTWNSMSAVGTSYNTSITQGVSYLLGTLATGSHTVSVRCNDSANNQGSALNYTFTVLPALDTVGPIVTALNITPINPNMTSSITVTATGSDATTGGSNISMCQLSLDASPTWNNMTASGGSYGTQATQNVTYSLGSLSSGNHTVSVRCVDSANNTGNSSTRAFTVAYVDTTGPLVTALSITPSSPKTTDSIVVNATGSDTTTGNSNISLCQLSLDGSPTWNSMTAVGGAYGTQVTQPVSYSLGTLSAGSHTISVRCNDTAGNLGNMTNLTFTVTQKGKPILFVTLTGTASTNEQYWINWLGSHSSALGLSWSRDQVQLSNVTSGQVNLSAYNMTIMADYPAANTTLNTLVQNYMTAGHYFVCLGVGAVNCVPDLGFGTGTGTSQSRQDVKILAAHYITSGYTVGSNYNVMTSSSTFYSHNSFTGTAIVSQTNGNGKVSIGSGTRFLVNGLLRTDLFTADGNTFATRTIDYGLNNSAAGN